MRPHHSLAFRCYVPFFIALCSYGCQLLGGRASRDQELQKIALIDARQAQGEISGLDQAQRERLEQATLGLLQRDDELESWVLPLIASYLPPGSEVPKRVHVAVSQVAPLILTRDGIKIDVLAPWWNGRSHWVGVIQGLYLSALSALAEVAPAPGHVEPETLEAFSEVLLDQLQRLGMASFVAGHGVDAASATKDFTLFMPRQQVESRVQVLQLVLRQLQGGLPPAAAWNQLEAAQRRDGVIAVIGAYMAKVLEARLGKAALVQLVQQGPRAFYAAYGDTEPGALVFVPLPSPVPQSSSRQATAH